MRHQISLKYRIRDRRYDKLFEHVKHQGHQQSFQELLNFLGKVNDYNISGSQNSRELRLAK